ncbi:AraC family transcriptional regulator [Paenibacillus mesophilus]|uniref:AraC family transcriptional regulator n=1 Tax=Paenibacillus mesophilus TaxID=2582849 RepID=UPI00192E4E6C|nr:AraC family transcriptional regulator [Paenibacillus mesophilus]
MSTGLLVHYYSKERATFKLAEEVYVGWALLVCEEGRFHYEIGDQSGEVRVGEAVLCPPGQVLRRKALSPLIFHFAHFHLQAFSGKEPTDFPYTGKLTFRNSSRLLHTLACLRESRLNVSRTYAEHLLNDILYQYIEECAARRKESAPQDAGILEALRYIDGQAFGDVSMQRAAARAGLSQSQFTRKFQKEMGISPVKYLTQLRMQKAKQMLTDTEEPLEKIAEQCGYQNAFYLSRVFSKEMDMSPSRYRSSHRV